MNGKLMLYVDQYGGTFYSRTVQDLARALGCTHVNKMYRDGPDGEPVHIGYVIRGHWLKAYVPYAKSEARIKASESVRL